MRIMERLKIIFREESDGKFINRLYEELFNRKAYAKELQYYKNLLSAGESRFSILNRLSKSRELKYLYYYPIRTPNNKNKTIANSLRYIFTLKNDDFIKSIYNEILCREAEHAELTHYLKFLNSTKVRLKFNLLTKILTSEEAQALLHRSTIMQEIEKNIFYDEFKPMVKKDIEQLNTGKDSAGRLSLNKKISIIILTWNGLEHTKKCLESLRYLNQNPFIDVIVFDNGSTDGTVKYLKSINWIKAIYNDQNIGFTAGNNKALEYCSNQDDIILLNNDMIIEQKNWIALLQETAYKDQSIGIVGSRLIGADKDLDGKLLHAGTNIYADNCTGQQIGGLEMDVNQYSAIRDVQGIVFACAYIKRELIEKIGFLDTDYFAYFEDTDYCLRAIKNGYRVVLDGRVTLKHIHNGATKVNKVNFWNIYKPSQQKFRKKWEQFLLSQYEMSVNWHSCAGLPFLGYSNSSKNIMLALDQNNVDVRYQYVYGEGTPIPLTESPNHIDDYRIKLFRQRLYNSNAAEIVYGQGDAFFKNKGRYKIGYTMLEVDGLPKEWVRQCNLMDEVWVPSAFNEQTFRQSGVKVPIHVIPLGIDPNYFNPQLRGFRFSDKFTFLSVFEWGERKAPEKLIKTFLQEFADNDDVLLVCKINNNDPSLTIPQEIQKLGCKGIESKMKILHNQKIPGYLMGSLYRSADCFVLPTRGEGWGMPILEAMACGTPTIATNWSAQTEFFNEITGYPINLKKLVPAEARCPYYDGFKWAEPDFEHLAFLMRHVYENHKAVQKKSMKTAQDILEKWTWDQTALKIKSRLQTID